MQVETTFYKTKQKMVTIAWSTIASNPVSWEVENNIDWFAVVFDNTVIADCENTFITIDNNLIDMWNFDFDFFLSPTTDGWWVYRHNATTRTINLVLHFLYDTKQQFEKKVDHIKEKITTTQGRLEFNYNEKRRRIKASITNFSERQETKNQNNAWLFDVSLSCIWDMQDKYTTSQTIYQVTWNTQITAYNNWTKLVYPNILITFGVGTNCTQFTIKHWEYSFIVTWSFLSWDTVVLYWENENKTLEFDAFKNWVKQTSSWLYPTIWKWWENFVFEFVWSVVDTKISLFYKQKYC